ncbi:TlpA disulfide reductase family protein [Olivibacter sitiensis]|uniref:TlpA disulfide reductase family protein n=1 Tax=Olivibacter sitiensis TaxID=376470 RepID=UPI0003F94C6D|nr:TlpA disulfide reductase family protein [Olivibacter sitiensis]
MKNIKSYNLRFLLTVFSLFAFSCLSAQDFSIEGHFRSVQKGINKVYLTVYSTALARNPQFTDSTAIIDGKFTFKGKLPLSPTEAKLFTFKDKQGDMSFGERYAERPLYIDSQPILLLADSSLAESHVYNSRINFDQLLFERRMSTVDSLCNERVTALNKEFRSLPDSIRRSDEYHRYSLNIFKENDRNKLPIWESFIRSYPDSWISLFLVFRMNNTSFGMLPSAALLFENLSDSLKNSHYGREFKTYLDKIPALGIDSEAPNFSIPDTSGKVISLESFRGHYVLLEFWASWCGPCRAESPFLTKAYKKYHESGFNIVSISLDTRKDEQRWKQAIIEDGTGSWAQLADMKGWKSDAALLYDIRSIPANFLIDPDGKIVAKDLRGPYLEEKLEEIYR